MKNFKITSCFKLLVLFFSLSVLTSCSDDTDTGTPPIIDKVSLATDTDLQPITQGYANNMYIVQGSGFSSVQKIYFNDVDTYFNPTLVTDNSIFVTIDVNTPYEGGSNKLIVVTKNGSVEYNFVVAPPAPIFKGFQPINAADGQTITIKGNFFLNPIVTVGGTAATIVSYTLTEIVAVLPTGSQGKRVAVQTISGSVEYSSQIGTAIYDDAFYGSVTAAGWGETHNLSNTDSPSQGNNAIKVDIQPWSGFQLDTSRSISSNVIGIKFFMKATTPARMRLVFNGDWGNQVWVDLTTSYQEFFIPWSNFGLTGPPANFSSLVFGSDGVANAYYIDDIGYRLN